MLTVCGQQHSFSTHERVYLWKCQSFWDREYLDLKGTRTPNLRIHAECSNILSYQGQTFASPCFWTLAVAVQIFLSKVNIWNVNCARATAFIFDKWTGVLVKESKIWDKKCLDLSGLEASNLRIHAECSNLLSYRGQTFAVPCFFNTGSGGIDSFKAKLAFELLTVRGHQHSFFDTRTGVLVTVSKF